MKRIALVVQRYGHEVNGGAELLARLLARALQPHYAIDVLTSRALDYQQWDRHYPPGEQTIDGCRVLRFEHPPRDRSRRKHMPLRHKLRFLLRRWLTRLGVAPVAQPSGSDAADGIRYLRAQGPTTDGLIDHLKTHSGDYAALIFVTARFFPAALGVLVDPARSILVPNLHDEKTMVLPHFQRVFHAPRCIMYNTRAEREVARRLYGDDLPPGEIAGVGVAIPPARTEGSASVVAAHLGVEGAYLMYAGRIDESKGCGELFDHFVRLRSDTNLPLKLVVCGRLFMARPDHPDIVLAGFVEDRERDDLLAHASALVMPSRHESLSLVLLEAMAAGCATIVSAHSEVLMQHVNDSGVGHSYRDYAGFASAVHAVMSLSAAQTAAQAAQARAYVTDQYQWPRIVELYRRAIDGMATRA